MSYYLDRVIDFAAHNAAVQQLMRDFARGCHRRIPVQIRGSIRNLLSNPEINATGYSFADFFTKAEAQIQCQLHYDYYLRHNVLCDVEMGLPAAGWQLAVDFQNSYDQAWFGAPLQFFAETDVPDTVEIYRNNPERLYQEKDPDPFWGEGDFTKRMLDIYHEMHEACSRGLEFQGVEVKPPLRLPLCGTDGIFTLACKLRGTVELICDMLENPTYYHQLLDYVTRALRARLQAHYEFFWDENSIPPAERNLQKVLHGYADDAIAMLSTEHYREFVLPYQQRLFDEFYDGQGMQVHLCGDATHHFKFLADTFNVTSFDTGFPVDHGKLRQELGEKIQINGGPTIMLVKDGTPAQIAAETEKICRSGVLRGGRFVLIAANNLAPQTPIANIQALYDAGIRYGQLIPGAK